MAPIGGLSLRVPLIARSRLIRIRTYCALYNVNVHCLERGVEYEFHISGQNQVGFGQEATEYFNTPEGPPTGPPINVSYEFQTPDVVCIVWDEPSRQHRNGLIVRYDVQFHKKIDQSTITHRNTTLKKVRMINPGVHAVHAVTNRVVCIPQPLGGVLRIGRSHRIRGNRQSRDRRGRRALESAYDHQHYQRDGPRADGRQSRSHFRSEYTSVVGSRACTYENKRLPRLLHDDGRRRSQPVERQRRPGDRIDGSGKPRKNGPVRHRGGSAYRQRECSFTIMRGVFQSKTLVYTVAIETRNLFPQGFGRLSEKITVIVKPDEVPLNLRASEVSTHSMTLSWTPPIKLNPIGYKISFNAVKEFRDSQGVTQLQLVQTRVIELNKYELSHTIDDLSPFISYAVNVSAVPSDRSYRPPSRITVTTQMAAPQPMVKPDFFGVVNMQKIHVSNACVTLIRRRYYTCY